MRGIISAAFIPQWAVRSCVFRQRKADGCVYTAGGYLPRGTAAEES